MRNTCAQEQHSTVLRADIPKLRKGQSQAPLGQTERTSSNASRVRHSMGKVFVGGSAAILRHPDTGLDTGRREVRIVQSDVGDVKRADRLVDVEHDPELGEVPPRGLWPTVGRLAAEFGGTPHEAGRRRPKSNRLRKLIDQTRGHSAQIRSKFRVTSGEKHGPGPILGKTGPHPRSWRGLPSGWRQRTFGREGADENQQQRVNVT